MCRDSIDTPAGVVSIARGSRDTWVMMINVRIVARDKATDEGRLRTALIRGRGGERADERG